MEARRDEGRKRKRKRKKNRLQSERSIYWEEKKAQDDRTTYTSKVKRTSHRK
jgi:hypothetical protein